MGSDHFKVSTLYYNRSASMLGRALNIVMLEESNIDLERVKLMWINHLCVVICSVRVSCKELFSFLWAVIMMIIWSSVIQWKCLYISWELLMHLFEGTSTVWSHLIQNPKPSIHGSLYQALAQGREQWLTVHSSYTYLPII